jgi:hypothetical protein
MALMVLPVICSVRGYCRWPVVAVASPEGDASLSGLPWTALVACFLLGLALTFGLVIMGENLSPAEARTRRQAWVPAAVMLGLTIVCFGANVLGHLWFAAGFSAANAVLFGAVVARYLRARRPA